MAAGTAMRRLVAATAAALALSIAGLAPAHAEDAPIGDAVLHGVGAVVTSVGEEAASLGYTLATDGGAAIAFSGGIDGVVRGERRFDGTFRIPAGLAAAAGVVPGETVEADSDRGASLLAATSAPFETLAIAEVPWVERRPSQAASGPPTTHVVDVAVVAAGREPSSATMQSAIAEASAYWVEGTNGGLTGLRMQLPVMTYQTSVNCEPGAEEAYAAEAASLFGRTLADYTPGVSHLDPPRHLLVILPVGCDRTVSWGRGTVGEDASSSGWVTMPARSGSYAPTLIHELGHNFGLLHSNAIADGCDASVLWLEPTCGEYEYWDLYSPMALEIIGDGVPALDAAHRAYFGFAPGRLAVHASDTAQEYTLRAATNAASGLQAIRVDEPGTGRILFIEYRDGSGADAAAAPFLSGTRGRNLTNSDWIPCSEPSPSCPSGFGFGTGVRVVEAVPGEWGVTGDLDGTTWATPVVTNASFPSFRELAEEGGERYISAAGTVRIDVLSTGAGSATVRVDTTTSSIVSERVGGADRFAVAVNIAQQMFPEVPDGGVPAVFVARGDTFPDALSASAAAALLGGPVLLTNPGQLPSAVAAEIRRLAPQRLVIVGGIASVRPNVANALGDIVGDDRVVRLAGADRYAASRSLVEAVWASDEFGAPPDIDTIYLAKGSNFPDALGATSAAALVHGPVLLVNGDANQSLDAATVALIGELLDAGETVKIAGGPASISDGIRNQLIRLGYDAPRLGGLDRFEAAVNIVNDAFEGVEPPPTGVFFAAAWRDDKFADALAGAAWAGQQGWPLLVLPQNCVPFGVSGLLGVWGTSEIRILGGTASLGSGVDSRAICF